MSKRKAKYKSKADRASSVPEEILAEGSGGTAVHVQADESGDEVRVEAEPVVEEAVAEPVKKGKRGKKQVAEDLEAAPVDPEPMADEVLAAPDEGAAVEAAPAEPAAKPAVKTKGKRGKKAHVDDASNEELAEIVAEAVTEAEEAAVETAASGEPEVVFDASAEGAEVEAEPQLTDDGAPIEASADGEDGEDAEVEVEGVMPTSAASLDDNQLRSLVEALVFAADKPITVQRLRQLTRVADVRRLETALSELQAEYANRGVVLQQVSGGFQFRTQTKFSAWVQQLIQGRPVRLSRAQLETLAIVAYRQPITRPEIDDIRGVDSSATLKLLMDRTLIRVLGKREEVGRPTLFGTTKEFLDFFSLGDLRELPTLREYSELTDESRKVMKDRLGIDPGGSGGGGNDSGGGEPGSAPPSDDGGAAPPADGSPGDASAAAAEADAEAVADAEMPASDATDEHVRESDSVFARYAHEPAVEGDGAPELIGEAYVEDDSERIGSAHAPVSFAEVDVEAAEQAESHAQAAADEGAPELSDEGWPLGSMPIAKADYGLEPTPEAVEHDATAHDGVVPTDEAVDDGSEHDATGE